MPFFLFEPGLFFIFVRFFQLLLPKLWFYILDVLLLIILERIHIKGGHSYKCDRKFIFLIWPKQTLVKKCSSMPFLQTAQDTDNGLCNYFSPKALCFSDLM